MKPKAKSDPAPEPKAALPPDHHAARIWDLLRHHPLLQRDAKHLLRLARCSSRLRFWDATAKEWLNPHPHAQRSATSRRDGMMTVDRRIKEMETSGTARWNPFAALIFRWLFEPDYHAVPQRSDKGARIRGAAGRAWRIGPPLLESSRPGYPGPLALADGPFTLETPWPETPKLFRDRFQRHWADFAAGGSLQAGRMRWFENWDLLKFNPQSLNQRTLVKLRQFREMRDAYVHFAVPRLVYTTAEIRALKQQFAEFLDEVLPPRQGKADSDKAPLTFHPNKLPHLFGTKVQWEVFEFCRPRVRYLTHVQLEQDAAFPFQRTGLGAAIGQLIKTKKQSRRWREGSNMETHRTRDFQHMENLVRAVYPRFDIRRILCLASGPPSKS